MQKRTKFVFQQKQTTDKIKYHYLCQVITNEKIWMVMAGLVPLFASITWMFLLLLGLRDSKTKTERGIKMSFLHYLIAFTTGYSLLILYISRPYIRYYTAPLVMAAFMLTPVLFYRSVWLFTDGGREEPFPYAKHLFVTIALALILSGWLPFIPAPVQSDMIAGREVGSDYYLLSLIFRCKPPVQIVFISMYVFLLLRRLIKYNRAIHPTDNSLIHPSRRMLYTIMASFMVPVVSALLLLTPQQEPLSPLLSIVLVIFFVVLHSFAGYSIIRSNFIVQKLPPIKTESVKAAETGMVVPKKVMRQIAERVENEKGKMVTIPLTRKLFEVYIKEQKPYLNADLKITDLIDPLKANRTVISNFVNKTYGLNFNQYINQLRIKELERLKEIPSNADKDIAPLLSKAGFSSKRNYKRAITIQQEKQISEK